ncbi:MAG: winged helix-turn-helix transcriptional regulator [Acidobacteriota bacterium]|nr:MAG: winged helix-turn-helix transcriptional regulator [Acidobacteriota bacterium]
MIKTKAQYDARAEIAKALSHPTRLLLLDALAERDLCVGELTEIVGADQSTVSKHLAVLKDAGFVEVEKRGTMSFYSIRCQCLDQFFGCIESVLRQKVRAQQDLVEL